MKSLFKKIKKNKKLLAVCLILTVGCLGILISVFLNLGVNSAIAADDTTTTGGGATHFKNPISSESFEGLIRGFTNWILTIIVSLTILFLIIGGLMYITSAGNQEQAAKAKKIILYTLLGFLVVLLSVAIINELKEILGVEVEVAQ